MKTTKTLVEMKGIAPVHSEDVVAEVTKKDNRPQAVVLYIYPSAPCDEWIQSSVKFTENIRALAD